MTLSPSNFRESRLPKCCLALLNFQSQLQGPLVSSLGKERRTQNLVFFCVIHVSKTQGASRIRRS